MERRKRTNKKLVIKEIKIINRLIIIGIIIAFIFNISLLIYNYHYYQQKQDWLLQEKNDQKQRNKNLENIFKEIDFINNIDRLIIEEQNNYYQNIKELEDKIIKGESKKKIAYLTFDDGPYYATYDFLKVLDQKKVKATFFTIGSDKVNCYDDRSKKCYPLYREEFERGHTIANHTYSHAIRKGLYRSADAFIEQVKKQEKFIYEQIGIKTKIVRFPGGSATAGNKKQAIIKKLRELGYGWVDWTAQDGDGGGLKNKADAWKNFTNSIDSNIEVVLFHDYSRITLSILPEAIDYLRNKGYELFPLFYESNMVHK